MEETSLGVCLVCGSIDSFVWRNKPFKELSVEALYCLKTWFHEEYYPNIPESQIDSNMLQSFYDDEAGIKHDIDETEQYCTYCDSIRE